MTVTPTIPICSSQRFNQRPAVTASHLDNLVKVRRYLHGSVSVGGDSETIQATYRLAWWNADRGPNEPDCVERFQRRLNIFWR